MLFFQKQHLNTRCHNRDIKITPCLIIYSMHLIQPAWSSAFQRPKEGNEESRCLTAKYNHHRTTQDNPECTQSHKPPSYTQPGLHSLNFRNPRQGIAFLLLQTVERGKKKNDRRNTAQVPSLIFWRNPSSVKQNKHKRLEISFSTPTDIRNCQKA